MKISIVIAVYNDSAIDQCLHSIFQSESADWEVIVVDDGSTSVDIGAITKKYPACRTFFFNHNRGPAAARNFGVRQATGEIVFFIDSDAQVYPDTLQKILGRFKNDGNVQGVTITWSREANKPNFFNKFKSLETNYTINHLWTKSFGSNGSAIYKDIFWAEGGFSEDFKTANAEDFWLGLKLFSKGYNIVLAKDILMKNSYLDRFFFLGLKKYCRRAFLRAITLYQIKNKVETSYNSKKLKIMYFLAILIAFLIIVGCLVRPIFWLVAVFYLIFFYLSGGLYRQFYEYYGLIFAVKAVILHYFYILSISVSGVAGLFYARLAKKQPINFQ